MKRALVFALLILAGCSNDQPVDARISIGQSMSDARQIAQTNGYRLHDASGLAMEPTPGGFYIAVTTDQDLLVLQNNSGEVTSLTIITNPARPKSERTYSDVKAYVLPAIGG